ncbi:MAG: hypothetical protein ACRCUP_06400 [Mycoplasmatales bacterium]
MRKIALIILFIATLTGCSDTTNEVKTIMDKELTEVLQKSQEKSELDNVVLYDLASSSFVTSDEYRTKFQLIDKSGKVTADFEEIRGLYPIALNEQFFVYQKKADSVYSTGQTFVYDRQTAKEKNIGEIRSAGGKIYEDKLYIHLMQDQNIIVVNLNDGAKKIVAKDAAKATFYEDHIGYLDNSIEQVSGEEFFDGNGTDASVDLNKLDLEKEVNYKTIIPSTEQIETKLTKKAMTAAVEVGEEIIYYQQTNDGNLQVNETAKTKRLLQVSDAKKKLTDVVVHQPRTVSPEGFYLSGGLEKTFLFKGTEVIALDTYEAKKSYSFDLNGSELYIQSVITDPVSVKKYVVKPDDLLSYLGGE